MPYSQKRNIGIGKQHLDEHPIVIIDRHGEMPPTRGFQYLLDVTLQTSASPTVCAERLRSFFEPQH